MTDLIQRLRNLNRTVDPELIGAYGDAEQTAFRAGWNARSKAIDDYLMHDKTPDVDEAFEEYQS